MHVIMALYEPTSNVFPVMSLRDRIRTARETGIVEEAISVPSSFDESFDDYDPASNIRESKLESFEAALQDSIDASLTNAAQSSVVTPDVSSDISTQTSESPALTIAESE